MKGFKPLKLKDILKRREKHPEDKQLHEVIDNAKVDDKDFDVIVKEATKHEAFDKKK